MKACSYTEYFPKFSMMCQQVFFPSVVFAYCFPLTALIAESCIMPLESGALVPDLLLENNYSLNVDLENSVFNKPTSLALAWS